jgi:serine/threonine-protein kinase HipA
MTSICQVCLEPSDRPEGYHEACLGRLFGAPWLPDLDLELASLHTAGLAMVGRATVSGVQRKVSLSLSSDRRTLRVMTEGWHYILKPQTEAFPHLPENEHLTMRLAGLCKIPTPEHGLIPLRDGTPAFIVRRFDRPSQGGKRRQEDFCQLSERPPKDKYRGSAELCGKLTRRFASEPGIAMRDLYRRQLFAWWTGNGDMHLKNFSLAEDEEGRFGLAPAYDQVCTRLVIADDDLALPIDGRRKNLRPSSFKNLARAYELPARAAARVARGLCDCLEPALTLVHRAPLPQSMRTVYAEILCSRASLLAELAARD